MSKSYIVKEKNSKKVYSETMMVDEPEVLNIVSQPIRTKLLKLLSKEPLYPAEIAKKLSMHEQKIYYHIKQLVNAGVIEIAEKKEIRGTTAKKFRTKSLNFSVCLAKDWKNFSGLAKEGESMTEKFLWPFIEEGKINSSIIVGSPDPHGPFKARARDGHYAIDLALFLGQYGEIDEKYITKRDVDVSLKGNPENMIVVGGPAANMISSKVNEFLPARFSDSKPWGLVSTKDKYTEETTGIIARIKNPFDKTKHVLYLAGISSIGTKAAVIAMTRHTDKVLSNFSTPDEEWFRIVQGFDLDSDGRIDSVEIIE